MEDTPFHGVGVVNQPQKEYMQQLYVVQLLLASVPYVLFQSDH